MSVLWPSKYAKIRFRPGLCPGPRWGSSRRSPRPLSQLERGHPSPYRTPLGTDPPSALAMRPPEVQPDLRLLLAALGALKFGFNALRNMPRLP